MMADELLNAQDLITAKKHDTFHSEVITGKAGGVSTGANIDYATNAVTGQTQTTLPKLLSNVGFSPAGFDFTTGGTLTERDKAIFYQADGNWYSWGGTLPKVVPPASSPASTGGIADNAWNVSTSAFMYRDWEGFTAELLAQAGIVDDGQPDEIGNSKRVDAISKICGRVFANVDAMLAFNGFQEGQQVEWQGYYTQNDGGGNTGVVKIGAHTHDGGSIFSVDANTYIEANHKGKKVSVLKFGASFDIENNTPFINAAIAYLHDGTTLYFPQGNSAGDEYKITETIVNSKRINFEGDTYWGSVIRNSNTSGAAAVEFNTTWYQTVSKLGILGNPSSGNGFVLNSSNFKMIECRVDSHGANGIYITPQNWTIQILSSMVRSNGVDGINAVATGPAGQINAVDIDGSTITFNGRDGIRVSGTEVNITKGTVEENASCGVRLTSQFYSTYGVNVIGVHMEGNKDGHIFLDCYPSLGFQHFKVNIKENYFLMDAANANPGASIINAVTDTPYDGIVGINVDNSNMILATGVKHVNLNDAVSKQAQSRIESVMTGDTSDPSLFYTNLGNCAVETYQKTKVLSGYFTGKGTLTHSSLERSANVNSGILAGPINGTYPMAMHNGQKVKKLDVYISSNNTNYSVIFNIWKRNTRSLDAYSLATTYTLSGLTGSGVRSTVDFATLAPAANTFVASNEEYYLEMIFQSNAGGGTFFYVYNPIVTYYG